MKLILINSYLNKFDSLRGNPTKNAYELAELRDEISSIISQYTKKHKKEDVFTDILNFIELDINYEIEKACETLEEDRGVQL